MLDTCTWQMFLDFKCDANYFSVYILLQQGYRVNATVRSKSELDSASSCVGGAAFLDFLRHSSKFAPQLTIKEANLTVNGSFDDAIAGTIVRTFFDT